MKDDWKLDLLTVRWALPLWFALALLIFSISFSFNLSSELNVDDNKILLIRSHFVLIDLTVAGNYQSEKKYLKHFLLKG